MIEYSRSGQPFLALIDEILKVQIRRIALSVPGNVEKAAHSQGIVMVSTHDF